MKLSKQNKLKVLGASIILILLLLPGITLAQQAIKIVYSKMVAEVTVDSNINQQVLGEPITAAAESTIENELNTEAKPIPSEKIQEEELYGNQLAYVDEETQELVTYNLETKERVSISKNGNFKEQLAMTKDKLIWTEQNVIWAYNFKDAKIERISENPGDLSDIYENLVVYRGLDSGGIYLYNFDTKKTETIAAGRANGIFTAPTIWKDIITWGDDSDGNLNIYYYDLKSQKTSKITNFADERYLGNPVATKKSIVYPLVDEQGVRQLMEYDLKTGRTITIPGLKKGKFRITVDKYDGGTINYYRTYDEVVTINVDTKEVKEYNPMDNKAMYGGVIVGTEKATPTFKVHRDH